jgi:hypothetical protein
MVGVLSVRERDPFLCAAGSFFFPGLGQVYCGGIRRGLVFLIPAILLQVPYAFIYLFHPYDWTGFSILFTLSFVLIGPVGPVSQVVDFLVRAVATYDAYKIAKPAEAAAQSHPSLPARLAEE